VRLVLTDNALDLGPQGTDAAFGFGRIDALAAVNGLDCGNGAIDTAEECDDANSADGDGCDTMCEIEVCFQCEGEPSVCQPEDAAPCDDGNTCTTGDTCSGGICTSEQSITTCTGGDGCCPDACDWKNDDDCPASIPALSGVGCAALVGLLAFAMALAVRRRRVAPI
jgi:cysteine-rich repeat protein